MIKTVEDSRSPRDKASRILKRTDMTRLRRAPKRGQFDRASINAILDATPLCHLGHVVDGRVVVIPTCHWRVDDRVYWHGSRLSRAMLAAEAEDVCLTVTHLDGMVLARSAFHHSANYRSAMIFGKPELMSPAEDKKGVLRAFIEGMFPGRWDMLRPYSRKEMNATTVLSLPIEEASAKVRSGPPIDLQEDLALPIWAGVIPTTTAMGRAQPCPENLPGVRKPRHVGRYQIG